MSKPRRTIAIGVVSLAIVALAAIGLRSWLTPDVVVFPDSDAKIRPDYRDVTVPPNIAPLNFVVQAARARYTVALTGGRQAIEIVSRSPAIRIPDRKWRRLVAAAKGDRIDVRVAIGQRGREEPFDEFAIHVADEPIDPYLSYRKIPPAFNLWGQIEIRQRDLESFDDRPILQNKLLSNGCINCHSYRQNHTDRMTIGIRSADHGSSTFMAVGGKPVKVGTKFGYTAWHPSGQVVAYSANMVRQYFHAARTEVRDVVDLDSELAYYDLRTATAKSDPSIAEVDRLETYPAWTPDGGHLYFSSAPILWPFGTTPVDQYPDCRYDLRRVTYDLETDTWGEPETVLSAEETGKSILLPRVSPDGRFVLLSMCDYGCFPVYQPSSDLYLLAVTTGECKRLDINSDESESWHSWSSNSRWIAFSSKRRDGVFTRTYFSYVDSSGRAHKPFIMPQKDPTRDDRYLWTYSVPELHVEPVPLRQKKIAATITSSATVKIEAPVTLGDRGQPEGAGEQASSPWRQGR